MFCLLRETRLSAVLPEIHVFLPYFRSFLSMHMNVRSLLQIALLHKYGKKLEIAPPDTLIYSNNQVTSWKQTIEVLTTIIVNNHNNTHE